MIALLLPIFTLASLLWGATDYSIPELLDRHSIAFQILWELRIPRVITAMVAGSALAVSGLLMQTVFRNVLAGPYVLGISSGASLGVAVVLLLGLSSAWSILGAASVGAGFSMALVLCLSRYFKNSVTLLVVGLMVGYLVDAAVSLLIHFGDPERLRNFITWGFGSFGHVNWEDVPRLTLLVILAFMVLMPTIKYLNSILLGEEVSLSLGIRIGQQRFVVLGVASFLAAIVTIYCGPISFIGMAVPQLARMLLRTADHRILLPVSMLLGAELGLAAGWIANLPAQGGALPLNAATALLGAPIVLWTLLRGRGYHA